MRSSHPTLCFSADSWPALLWSKSSPSCFYWAHAAPRRYGDRSPWWAESRERQKSSAVVHIVMIIRHQSTDDLTNRFTTETHRVQNPPSVICQTASRCCWKNCDKLVFAGKLTSGWLRGLASRTCCDCVRIAASSRRLIVPECSGRSWGLECYVRFPPSVNTGRDEL